MPIRVLSVALVLVCLSVSPCAANDVLFEDNFNEGLSDKWKLVGLTKDDYRIRDGALELRLQPEKPKTERPRLWVELPFQTADTVIASVDATVIGKELPRNASITLFLANHGDVRFSANKTNINGFFVFSPGEVDFIGKPGQEGDPGKYTVKYWPADKDSGALRIIVRQHYAHFQVGPSTTGDYKTFFHSAIVESKNGLGFGLMATGGSSDEERWVRFDNFRVTK